MKQIFPGVWKKDQQFLTKNLKPGFRSYTEQLIKVGETEHRIWDPNRSKPAAAITCGLKALPIKPGQSILYLGIAQGFTASYFSDIIGKAGIIYGIEISGRAIRDLNPVAEKRGNIVPILADARKPDEWADLIFEPINLIYQDVAAPDQTEIIIRCAKKFLKPGCFAVIAIKTRSIDVIKQPAEIYKSELKKLAQHFTILDKVQLDPYEKAHMFVVMKVKK